MPRIAGITAIRRLPSRANSLRVLAYHKVSDQRPNIIAVGTSLFRQQQEYLAANYRVISPDELADHLEFGTLLPDKAVLLTFDDGYTSVFRHAHPVLKEIGHRAIMFVPTDYIGGGILPHDRVVAGEDAVLSYEELASMRDVFEMGSHGCSHRILTHLQPHEIECEIVESKLNLERRLGINVRAFAYPNGGFGDYNELPRKRSGAPAINFVSPGSPEPIFLPPIRCGSSATTSKISGCAISSHCSTDQPTCSGLRIHRSGCQ